MQQTVLVEVEVNIVRVVLVPVLQEIVILALVVFVFIILALPACLSFEIQVVLVAQVRVGPVVAHLLFWMFGTLDNLVGDHMVSYRYISLVP